MNTPLPQPLNGHLPASFATTLNRLLATTAAFWMESAPPATA
jgi:hypothetical protein